MVNKSAGYDVLWTHGGKLIGRQSTYYSFVGGQDPTITGLEISDATAEQAGFYEALIMEGSCHVRNIFEVEIGGKCFFSSVTQL